MPVTDTMVRWPLFSRPGGVLKLTPSWGALQRPSSLAPSHPWEPSGPPPSLPAQVMLPPLVSTRSLDIRQALHWLILACGPAPAHGGISHSFLHRCCQDEPVPVQPPRTSTPCSPGQLASMFWILRAGVRHLLSRTPVQLPNWSHQKPSSEARR